VLAALPETRERTLPALSGPAVAAVVRDLTGSAADELFCDACHEASAGNPFVLRELVRALLERGVAPDAEAAAQVARAGPPAVARWVLARLERLAADATGLARAVAVLGDDADLRRAASVAGLATGQAEAALDALVESELITPGRPLHFVHPVVQAAVRDAMPPGSRSRAQRTAARLLREEKAAPGRVATHLLVAEPGGECWVAEALLEAAHVALAQGAPEVAATQARRALAEPADPDLRIALLRVLGSAERRLGMASADDRFRAALHASTDARERAATVLDMLSTGPGATQPDVIELMRGALAAVATVDGELALIVRARLLLALETTDEPIGDDLRDAQQTLAAHDEVTLGTRLIAGVLARDAAFRGRKRATVLSLATRAVADDQIYGSDLRAGYPHMHALVALSVADEPALAQRRLLAAAEHAEQHGSLVGAAIALFNLARVRTRMGQLADSEADARRALELATRTDQDWLIAIAAASLIEALVERGELAAADAFLKRHEFATSTPVTPHLAPVAIARSELHLAAGRLEDAYADASAAGRLAQSADWQNPLVVPWRSIAALALIARGQRAQASALAQENLAAAEKADLPSAIGTARRVRALATTGDGTIPLLHDAVDVLQAAPAPLELARTLTELGAALRRTGQRRSAREPLARALEMAHRHGAAMLADRARTELLAAGARPRRVFRSGVDALTPSELRVARLAAAGLSNAEIAAALYRCKDHRAPPRRDLQEARHPLPARTLCTNQHQGPSRPRRVISASGGIWGRNARVAEVPRGKGRAGCADFVDKKHIRRGGLAPRGPGAIASVSKGHATLAACRVNCSVGPERRLRR
jgi:tetratricopeptide (TPR) repeat protein